MRQGDVIVGRFVAERRVREGGGGIVWRALDRLTGESVALKLLVVENTETMERFAREAGAVATLHHPAIVGYVAHGVSDEGQSYLATTWLEGETLADRLRRGALDLHDSIVVARHIAEALSVAHARSIVHRDVKPTNVLLRDGDVEKTTLIDFGVAHFGINALLTQPGSVLGTPSYMSPEQACGATDIDARSDVFGLGCLFFECLTGRTPFGTGDALAVLSKVVLQPPPHVRDLMPDVPRDIDDLVARMLAKDRSSRPSDGAAVAAELRAIEETSQSRAVTPPIAARGEVLTHAELGIVSIAVVGVPIARPEDATRVGREAEARDIERLRAATVTFGGHLAPLLDGSCVAVFSGRGNAGDQAILAARFALAARLVSPASPIGLATGRGVLSDGAALGEAIDRAVQLVRRARTTHRAPQGVFVDETSAAFLDVRFDVLLAPSEVLLVGERSYDEPVRTLRGKPTPFVGRERELESLERIVDESIRESAARVILVTAPSGIGKSRLRYELVRSLYGRPSLQVFVCRGDSVGTGSPFAMIGQATRRAVGMLDGEPAIVAQGKLEARVALHVPEPERARVSSFLGEIVGVRFPDDANEPLRAARRDPALMSDQMRCAWEDWLTAECKDHPLLLILEDLHWGDAPSVAFVDAALQTLHDLPLIVLALARPEVTDLFPALWAERHVEHTRLRPLGARAAEQLSRAALGDGVDDAIVMNIVERASGNALYLEELIRAVADGHEALPETVLAMVQARLERVEPSARHVLRAASVFGETFWEGGLRALVGGNEASTITGSLNLLAHRELISVRRQGRFPDEREYVFRHSLVREGAYAMLTDNDRAVGHQLAGTWLETKGETDAALLADHFEHGGDLRRAASLNVRAAKHALDANDIDGALARSARAETCGVTGVELGGLRSVQAAAQSWRGDTMQTISLAVAAMQLLPAGSAEWCAAAGYVIQGAGQRGQIDRVEGVADQLLALPADDVTSERITAIAAAAIHLHLAGRLERAHALVELVEELATRFTGDDPLLRGQIAMLHHIVAALSSDYDGIIRHIEVAVAAFERAGALRKACVARNDLGDTYMTLGLWDRAEHVFREVLATCERIGVGTTARLAQGNLALVMARRGRNDEALALVTEALDALGGGRNPRLEGGVRTYLATILSLAGDLDGAAREARAASETLAVAPPLKPLALAALARIELQRGHVEASLTAAREAMELLESLGSLCEGQALVRLAWSEALAAAGRKDEARAAIEVAGDALLARAAKIPNEEMRRSFLTIEEHARTLLLNSKAQLT